MFKAPHIKDQDLGMKTKCHFSAQLFAITTSGSTGTIFSKALPVFSIFLFRVRATVLEKGV
jgi:hypothetical protein